MKKMYFLTALVAGMIMLGGVASADPITWSENGHSYELIVGNTWLDAEAAAVANGGHLVTVIATVTAKLTFFPLSCGPNNQTAKLFIGNAPNPNRR